MGTEGVKNYCTTMQIPYYGEIEPYLDFVLNPSKLFKQGIPEGCACFSKEVIEANVAEEHVCDCEYCTKDYEEKVLYFDTEEKLNEYLDENYMSHDVNKEGGYGLIKKENTYIARIRTQYPISSIPDSLFKDC